MLSGSTRSLCGISSLSALPPAVNTAIWCRTPYVAISRHLRHVRTAVVGATWVSAGFTLHLAASSGVRMTSTGLTPELLHNSLVLDGAAPDGQLQSFLVFSEATMPASQRQKWKAATIDNVSTAVWPHKRPRDREAEAKQEKPSLRPVPCRTENATLPLPHKVREGNITTGLQQARSRRTLSG